MHAILKPTTTGCRVWRAAGPRGVRSWHSCHRLWPGICGIQGLCRRPLGCTLIAFMAYGTCLTFMAWHSWHSSHVICGT
eukprot:1152080-Pelagomonas_calceolata.AAC.1